ncbi:MAG: Lrp/AsnC family transcriptional regulator [Proteobacteria bacterium]|nr:Lrp/AsnC family transcriptional regulator [Pseudomonadota bacterium]
MSILLDDLDHRLIGLLRHDARSPAVTLARQLGVSRGTVQNRIERLQRAGAIKGFTLRLASEADIGRVRALMTLEIRSADIRPVVAEIRKLPEAISIHSTNGRWDIVIEVAASDLGALDRVISAIRTVPGVAHSETNILLSAL